MAYKSSGYIECAAIAGALDRGEYKLPKEEISGKMTVYEYTCNTQTFIFFCRRNKKARAYMKKIINTYFEEIHYIGTHYYITKRNIDVSEVERFFPSSLLYSSNSTRRGYSNGKNVTIRNVGVSYFNTFFCFSHYVLTIDQDFTTTFGIKASAGKYIVTNSSFWMFLKTITDGGTVVQAKHGYRLISDKINVEFSFHSLHACSLIIDNVAVDWSQRMFTHISEFNGGENVKRLTDRKFDQRVVILIDALTDQSLRLMKFFSLISFLFSHLKNPVLNQLGEGNGGHKHHSNWAHEAPYNFRW